MPSNINEKLQLHHLIPQRSLQGLGLVQSNIRKLQVYLTHRPGGAQRSDEFVDFCRTNKAVKGEEIFTLDFGVFVL